MTTSHGMHVCQIINSYSPSASFRFYRVTQKDTDGNPIIYQRHLQQAMGYAHLEDGVDIMNISLGNDHSNEEVACDMPNEPCKIRDAARGAIEDGICIVAGAGNAPKFDSISCPALYDDVIAVGGSASKCTARLSPDNIMSRMGREIKPPRACWLAEDGDTSEILCSGLDCSIDMTCDEQRRDVAWEGNVPPTDSKPDVYAPAAILASSDDGHGYISWGTSYAAPMVSSVVCELVSGLMNANVSYSPTVIKRAISENGSELDDGTGPLLDAAQAAGAISDHYDLSFELDPATSDSKLYSSSPTKED